MRELLALMLAAGLHLPLLLLGMPGEQNERDVPERLRVRLKTAPVRASTASGESTAPAQVERGSGGQSSARGSAQGQSSEEDEFPEPAAPESNPVDPAHGRKSNSASSSTSDRASEPGSDSEGERTAKPVDPHNAPDESTGSESTDKATGGSPRSGAKGNASPGDHSSTPKRAAGSTGDGQTEESDSPGTSGEESPENKTDHSGQRAFRQWLARLREELEEHKQYPARARRMGVEGQVRLRLRVHRDGAVESVEVLEPGDGMLTAAARSTVERAAPLPAPPDSREAPVTVEVPLSFRLNR